MSFNHYGNIIELENKEIVPDGVIGDGNVGHAADFSEDDLNKTTTKAIVDFGVLDVDPSSLKPKDSSVKFIGTTSDLTVYDLGENKDKNNKQKYHVGDKISFLPDYMSAARLMNSKFVNKIIK